MEFRRLTTSHGDIYKKARDLYEISFPYHELGEKDSQAGIMENDAYHFNLIFDENTWVGNMLYWETEDFMYVEHFCILPSMRNKRYGEKALEFLNGSGKTVILEIDPPVDDISVHRKAFYERAGFQANAFEHIHPPYHKEYDGHKLVIMSYPNCLSEMEYHMFSDYMKNVVMKT